MSDENGHTDGRGRDRKDTAGTAKNAQGPDALGITDIADIASFDQESDELDASFPDTEEDLELETPEADAAEQRAEVARPGDEPASPRPPEDETEADPADVADQDRAVGGDEEDYR